MKEYELKISGNNRKALREIRKTLTKLEKDRTGRLLYLMLLTLAEYSGVDVVYDSDTDAISIRQVGPDRIDNLRQKEERDYYRIGETLSEMSNEMKKLDALNDKAAQAYVETSEKVTALSKTCEELEEKVRSLNERMETNNRSPEYLGDNLSLKNLKARLMSESQKSLNETDQKNTIESESFQDTIAAVANTDSTTEGKTNIPIEDDGAIKKKAREMKSKGLPLSQISKELGITIGTAYNYCNNS